MKSVRRLAATAALTLSFIAGASEASAQTPVRNVVLVHGAYADGSGWRSVADILKRHGFKVSVVQEPETSLADDVAATQHVLDQQDGPAVLVGHSYGGAVITEAGNHAKVASLVYVAAFVPDEGETLGGLTKSKPGLSHSIMPHDGFLTIDPAQFPHDFAADVPLPLAQFMAISQVPQSISSAMTPIKNPAWKNKPVWATVSVNDRMINPDLERQMYARAKAKVTEIKASHAVFISQPAAVAKVIEDAARGIR